MSTTAGAFDETKLLNFMVRADEVLADGRIKLQYIPKYDALKAIMAIQNARVLAPISRSKKTFDVEVEWMNTCGMSVESNTDCVIAGAKASTNIQEYSLTYERISQFSVDETDFDDNRFDIEEAIAKQFLTADKLLIENLNSYAISRLNTFLGVNEKTGDKGDVVSTLTYVQPSYWNADLMGYFMEVAVINQMSNPVMLSGSNLYQQVFLAAAKAGNANGAGDPVLFGTIPQYWDLFNIDTINNAKVTYMIENGALAFANKTENPDMPQVVNGIFTRYTMTSRFDPNVKYDVYYTPSCTTGDRIVHNFKVKMKADIFINPAGCTSTNTGVLKFVCGTAPQN